MYVIDTLTKKKKNISICTFIRLYVCGSTVYDNCHLGHLRLFLFFDMVARYVFLKDIDVLWVRNITDVDLKIINKVHKRCSKAEDLIDFYIFSMFKDCVISKLMRPTFEPMATGYILQMLQLIDVLLMSKCAYISLNGDICFDVTSNFTYGKLSSQNINSLYHGIRIVADARKRSYSDFVLWKLCPSGILRWDSKWGSGRPGWHIECSAMVVYFFGDCVDYHGGGVDLIFPHHENECAQVESIFKKNYTDVWLHVGLILFDKQKMSKSYYNFVKAYDLLTIVGSDVIRYYFLRSHYKQPLEYNLDTIYNCEIFIKKIKSIYTYFGFNGCGFKIDYRKIFKTVFFVYLVNNMDADFNTPKSITIIQQLLYIINYNKQGGLYKECLFLISCLYVICAVLGFSKDIYVVGQCCDGKNIQASDFLVSIATLHVIRVRIRKRGQWLLADTIRYILYVAGFVVNDVKK